ncbi:hypothetical protein SteCoe_38998 [Stentor coeruleus]|uniref:Uncharacterized protein n=1 Tax=Stentor coeruleus TaxID=5963 RepID=A0A1R2AKX0_9CILI|nr:hypothetical protein SteCoe_38998 [Stentor coeruleus]
MVSKSNIVASYIYITKNGREIEYFELEEFKHFLYNRHKTQDGILQKFIDSKGRRNSAIQMVWTPHICIFEMRENQNDLYDQRLNLYERVITYEGDQHQSQIKPFKSMELRSFMQEVGEALVEHFSIISEGQSKPTRKVLVFKKDPLNRPWLLLCTSIRCSSVSPINISCNTKFPSVINVKRTASNPRNLLNA